MLLWQIGAEWEEKYVKIPYSSKLVFMVITVNIILLVRSVGFLYVFGYE